jgi:uncharacterized Zn-binding protein involved in type VI secretion
MFAVSVIGVGMPAVHRKGDACTGHGCFPPRKNIQASSNVIVNSKGWHRRGDKWASHCCGDSCHCDPPCKLAMGSSNVYVNSKNAGRIGDPVSCGSAAGTGSPTVFCGG